MKSAIAIEKALKAWLDPANHALRTAVFRTEEDQFFTFEDINYQLEVLRKNVQHGDIKEWVNRSGLSDQKNAKGKKVLCLHAGNLPLVGFQTALGVILSGADYYGKLSQEDPYLLASFLEEMKEAETEQTIEYATELSQFENLKADTVVFAGSENSVPPVKKEIKKLNAAKKGAHYLIRTAKFSIAYLEDWNEQIRSELTEAMLRYGGKGCRSVAMVVADFGLDEVKDELKSAIQKFWKENPQQKKPSPDLKYQYAYNKGIERTQLWMEDFLIQETDEFPDTDFTVNWVKGDAEKVRELRMQFGDKVQTVYTTKKKIEGMKTEELSLAQRPPLYWKPDGVDVISELLN